jgi:uncharacterized protein (DUF305 family)
MRVTGLLPLACCLLPALASGCTRASLRQQSVPQSASAPAPAGNGAAVDFMCGMIVHHAQALAMTRLVPSRTTARDIRVLAERIAESQRAEISLIEGWLERHGYQMPDPVVAPNHHAAIHPAAAGMLTPHQMDSLGLARGRQFDRLFLVLMIQHHRGALSMVQRLLASGGATDPEVLRFASDVDADQRAEIARMQRLLAARDSTTARQ